MPLNAMSFVPSTQLLTNGDSKGIGNLTNGQKFAKDTQGDVALGPNAGKEGS